MWLFFAAHSGLGEDGRRRSSCSRARPRDSTVAAPHQGCALEELRRVVAMGTALGRERLGYSDAP